MQATRDMFNDFGMEVTVFCARFGISKKQLAAEAGVPYDSLLAAGKNRRAGHVTRAAVLPVMEKYEAEAKRPRRKGRAAL